MQKVKTQLIIVQYLDGSRNFAQDCKNLDNQASSFKPKIGF